MIAAATPSAAVLAMLVALPAVGLLAVIVGLLLAIRNDRHDAWERSVDGYSTRRGLDLRETQMELRSNRDRVIREFLNEVREHRDVR